MGSEVMSDTEWPRISLKEFKQKGYLQEVNRRVLHPLGMAIAVIWPTDDEGNPLPEEEVDPDDVKFGGIYDYRDDPEGMVFGFCEEEPVELVDEGISEKAEQRKEEWGWVIQPPGSEGEVETDD